MKLRTVLTYFRSASHAIAQRPAWATFAFALRYAQRCIDSYQRGQPDFLAEATPWMCFPAVERLDTVLTAGSKVFEYGSGGSTIYFAQRAAEVVSVEHDRSWHRRVQAELERRRLANVRYQLVEPAADTTFDPTRIADPSAYVSDDKRYVGKTFRSYAQAIDTFPDQSFDLVVVDGRARPSCILHAREKVKPGGVLLLDQSERRYYLAKSAALLDPAQWHRTHYMAPLPYSLHFTEATFFTRTYQ
jgi:predicted O-methyltransferase YrrM